MVEKNKYSDETKAAVMASLLAGQSVSSVAREYEIPKGTVSGWKAKANNIVDGDGVGEKATQKKDKIGDLLLEYLITSLESLTAQARVFGDERWIAKQGAADIAVLHGVSTDKVIRLLEAIARSASAE